MKQQFTNKQITIIICCVTAFFVIMAIFTLVVGIMDDESEENDKTLVMDDGGSDEKGRKYRFDTKENREKGDQKKDSVVVNEPLEGDPYEELDELVGLESVKEEVHSLANFVKVQKMREEKGLKNPKLSYHLVFTGSPGTGKTTVARIVARIYKDLGILKKGHLVETDRSGLIGQYVGQTAPRVNAICDSALNGVLFIDEAYAITQSGSKNDYGDEAVATLLKRMEDDRDKLVVIVAGYTKEMTQFIESNPGLKSRFNKYINFPDYTPAELFDIFRLYLRKNEYTISNEAAEYLRNELEIVVKNKNRNFGNARYVRNLFEKAIQCQANRLSQEKKLSNQQLQEVTLVDIKNAFKELAKNPQ
ncbi:MAG: AAA family ATPase [Prevotella sp.]|nr:AAA family ATPase [Prevotella sp.]